MIKSCALDEEAQGDEIARNPLGRVLAHVARRTQTVSAADRQLLGRVSRTDSSTRDWIVCRVSSASDLPSLVICSNSD